MADVGDSPPDRRLKERQHHVLPLRDGLYGWLDKLEPHARQLGCQTELARCAGSQFDPAVVAACARIPDATLALLLEPPTVPTATERAA